MFKKLLLFAIINLGIQHLNIGQVNVVPNPCTNGTQNTCKCANAPILCSINQMNGFSYNMTTYSHPSDGPNPMCPLPEGLNTASQNPTWFAFIAWCTQLQITVAYTNCIDGPSCPGPSNFGVQAAIYSGCPATTANAITCDTDVAGCVNNSSRILNISGLTIGQTYYFLVDGCCGAACDIAISVVGNCSQSSPTPMTTFEIFPNVLCKPNATGFFKVLKNESTWYYWYIDGVQVANGSYLAATNLNFNALAPGKHTVCVDGSLLPCFSEADDPPPVCRDICITPSNADAGTINGNSPVCPGTTVPVSVTGMNTGAGFVNHVFVTKPNGEIIEVVPNNGTTTSLTSSTCQDYVVWSYNYYSPCYTDPILPVVGANVSTVQDSCKTCGCNLKSKVVSFADNVAPIFPNAPGNGTYACIFAVPGGGGPLGYTDNCIAPGSVSPVITGGADPCAGGTITYTWTKTDDCGNTGTHVQNVTVGPSVIAEFQNVPANITINCDDQLPLPASTNLTYTNGGSGLCLISGSVTPTVVANYTACAGGTVVYNWEFIDGCMRTITATRTITINPLAVPAFVAPPADITVDCNTIPPAIPNLNYTNGGAGACLISGNVAGVYDGPSPTVCGGTFNRKWTFTDLCNRTITYIQKITVTPVPQGNYVNPPGNTTVDCNAVPANGVNLTFTNGLTGPCLITSVVVPTSSGTGDQCGGTKTFMWTYTDACNRTSTHTQVVTINPIPIPSFVNPPPNITVTCENKPTTLPVLMVKNNDVNCPINANVTATQTGNVTVCGGVITFNWTYTDVCNRTINHTQTVTVDPMPQAAFVNPPADITVNCNQVPAAVGPTLQIRNTGLNACLIDQMIVPSRGGNGTQCGGTVTYTWTFTDVCNRTTTHVQTITINPIPIPAFVNPPANITVTCDLIPSSGPNLDAKNNDINCPINQSVAPVQTGSATICGGTITYTWTFTDVCNRTITHVQTVTVTPMPQAQFVNPPPDITVNCNQVPAAVGPSLQIKNTGLAACLIDQMIVPVRAGNGTQCGGTVTYTWTYTDVCNRTTTHVQNISINPIPIPAFVNPPANITVTCDLIPTNGPNLDAKNNDVNCPINQSVAPVQTGSATICGGTITYTWTFTDVCNRTISHVQTVTVTPMPQAQFVNPPPDVTVNCNQVPAAVGPSLQIKNTGLAACLIDQMIVPTRGGSGTQCGGTVTYTWTYTDVCNRTTTHVQTITINPIPAPAFVNPPANITVTCDLIPSSSPNLDARNNDVNCPINQSVAPVQTGSATICGGTITYTWTFTDVCNRTITHTQSVTVIPMPPATFINPPADITVTCDLIPTTATALQVKNNGPTGCIIDQQVNPVQTGSATVCGGTITYTWTYTDVCNRTITHVQNITVTPMPMPQFVNPPANVTVNCDVIPATGVTLTVVNNGPAGCNINTTVSPTQAGSATICGGTITYTWTFTDQCNRTINHIQTVTVTPMLPPQFVNPPANTTVSCNTIPASAPNLQVLNNGPVGCKIDESIPAVIIGTPNPCGGSFTYTWTYTDACNRIITHAQTITVTPTPQGAFVNPPSNELVTCDLAPAVGSFPSLQFTNNLIGTCGIDVTVQPVVTGSATACGGTIIATWSYTDFCGRINTHVKTVTVSPAQQASFGAIPANITVSCDAVDNSPVFVNYSNNGSGQCGITGSVENVRNGTVTYCGGTLQDIWIFTDICGRTISASRTITVLPAAKAAFTSLPADITLDCDDIIPAPDLSYTNNITGSCGIVGQVAPIQSGSYDACGGTVFMTWTFTDQCNRSINHTQKITINPAADPDFINPPQDENLDCGGVNNPPPFIEVNNGVTGPCGISINAPLVSVTQNGGTYTNTWQYTNPCSNQVFTHVQKTTTIAAPKLFVSDPDIEICAGETFDLSSIIVEDLNNTNPVITFHSTLPASASNEILPEIMPNPGDVYFIVGTNSLGCEDVVNIYFEVNPPANAGGDGTAKICNDGAILNLTTLLNGGASAGGSWKQLNGNNLNLASPTAVNFLNIPAGTYSVSYIVQGQANCPSDTALFSIEVTDQIDLKLAGVACIIGGTYEVKVITKAAIVTSSLGTVQKLTNDTIRVFNIPQGQAVVITATTANSVCKTTLSINAPDCSCPFVPEPLGPSYYSNCEAPALNISMSVNVPAGMQANWFTQPSGGVALISNSLSYAHTNGAVGLYKYYVETYNPLTDCYSLSRLEIVVEIFPKPIVQNVTYTLCDDANDGKETFDLLTIIDDVSSLANTTSFHLTLAEAQSGTNPLPSKYTNTSSPQTIYTLVVSNSGCKNFGTVVLSLWESPITNVVESPESCIGTKDGKIEVSNTTPGTYQYNLNNQGWSSNTTFTGLDVGNYILVTENQNGCRSQNNVTIDPGLLIVIKTFKIECDNKGTLSNPNDDLYIITVRVENNLNLAGNYSLTGDNGYNATYAYNTDITFTLPANGININFTAKDVLRGCSATRSIGPLTSCSTTCVADLKIISLNCNGNNTPSDPTDDFYEFKFSATALNGANNNQYNLYVDNVLKGLFVYGSDHMINIAATNQVANIKIVDNADIQCSDNEDIGPLNNCSDQCILTSVIELIDCKNPNSSPSPSDDYYEITIKSTLTNGGSSTGYKVITESGSMFSGVYNTSLKITLPADNLPHKLTIVDNEKNDCKDVLDINALTPCSGPCEVEVKIVSVTCSNNGTTNDSSDDIYEITIGAKLINGGSSDSYQATIDGKKYNGVYGKNLVIQLPADGKPHLVSVVDLISAECKGSVQTDLLTPCSVPCDINATVLTFDCDNGGTTSDTADDTYAVSIMVNISNGGTSTQYTATVDGNTYTGTYGKALIIPFKADNTVHKIDVKDNTNGACFASIQTPILAPCSGPCVIDVVVSNVICNNAGTNNTADDDEYFFDILVSGNNTKWKCDQLNVLGNVGNTTKLGPFKIKDAINTFLVYYENSPNCKKQVSLTVPLSCSECKQKIDAGNGGKISCTQNSILLTASSSAQGIYAWVLNGKVITNTLSYSAGQPGKYYFVANYSDGCKAIDSIEVTIDADLPLVTVTRELSLTCQIKEVTITATATGTGLKYEWTDEAGLVIGTDLTLTVNKAGKYYFRAYNSATGCSSSKVLSEVIKNDSEPSSIIYAKPTTLFDCVIKKITLFNDIQNDVAYTWKSNGDIISTNKTIEITSKGKYVLIAIDTISGCQSQSELNITSLIEYPIIFLSIDDTLDCVTEKVFISPVGSQVGPNITYEWKDKDKKTIGNSQSGIDIVNPGIYYLVLTDIDNGCTNEDTIKVESFENEIDIKIPLNIYVKAGDSIRLNTLINIPIENIKKITWTPKDKLSCSDCLNPLVVTEEDISYTVEIEDIFGCKGIAEVRLIITKPDVITIPNVMNTTSNTNGGFTLYGNDQVKLIKKLSVYDRWGNLMFVNTNFEPNKPELGWNGKFNNKEVVPGVYVYVFEVDINAIGSKVYSGDVTVIR